MRSYVECIECDFVLAAVADVANASPERYDSCPSCGGTDFRRISNGLSSLHKDASNNLNVE